MRSYTLSIIQDELWKHKGYEFLSKLNLNMQFYMFKLDEKSRWVCTILTPYKPFCYNRVSMGLKTIPAFAQAGTEEVICGIEETEVYLNNIGVFGSDWG